MAGKVGKRVRPPSPSAYPGLPPPERTLTRRHAYLLSQQYLTAHASEPICATGWRSPRPSGQARTAMCPVGGRHRSAVSCLSGRSFACPRHQHASRAVVKSSGHPVSWIASAKLGCGRNREPLQHQNLGVENCALTENGLKDQETRCFFVKFGDEARAVLNACSTSTQKPASRA